MDEMYSVKKFIVLVILLSTILAIGFLSNIFFKPDNIIEEFAEALIKKETGLDIEISP